MKKLLALVLVAAMASFVACGGGKDKAKEQKRIDSLKQDSIAKVKTADSLAAAEKEMKKLDSLKQDSITKADKKAPKKGGTKGGTKDTKEKPKGKG
jgi:Flp pilus assembly protein TadB